MPSIAFLRNVLALAIIGGASFGVSSSIAQSVEFIDSYGANGSGDGLFTNPFFVAANSADGTTYVGDNFQDNVQVFTGSGGFLRKFGLASPRGLAIRSSTGDFYGVSTTGNLVKHETSMGASTTWGVAGAGNGQFNAPRGIAVDEVSGEVYVADSGNHRVQRFDSAGTYLGQWGTSGTGDGQFDTPVGIAIDPRTSQIYVTDSTGNRVQRFSASGAFELAWGSAGSGAGQFSAPYGVAVDSKSRVYVVDSANNRVQRFDANGVYQLAFGTSGAGVGQFSTPRGIATLPDGVIAVVDSGNSRISRWRAFDPSAEAPKAPEVKVSGKKRFTTSRSTITLRGIASDPNENLSKVEVKVGNAKFRPAQGRDKWHFRVRLKAGINRIQVRAVDTTLLKSRSSKITVRRGTPNS